VPAIKEKIKSNNNTMIHNIEYFSLFFKKYSCKTW